MKKLAILLAAIVAFGAGIPTRSAMAASGMDKGVVNAEYIVVSATVDAIDYERRTITLVGPDSKRVTIRASREVRKLQAIKKGDLVSAEYLDAVAVIVRKPDGVSHPGFLKEVSVTSRGRESDRMPVDTVEAMGTVEAIDHELRIVTFKAPDGVIRTYKVDPRVKKLRDIVKGDRISVRATEPLAVSIKPAAK